MKSTRTKEIILVLASVGVCLLAGEFASRRFLTAPATTPRAEALPALHVPDPEIGWVLTTKPITYHHRRFDEHGVLQYDVVYSVPGGTRPTSESPHDGPGLIATGCSFTFGHAIKDEDTWPWQLQEGLPGYHVINSACMAYGTDQALMSAERQLRKHPGTALVVLGFGDFQIERNRAAQGWMVHVYPFGKPLFAITENGAEYQRQVRFLSGGFMADHSDLFAHIFNAYANRKFGVPSHEQAKDLTVALIDTFAKRFQALGARLVVVTLPYLGDQFVSTKAEREYVVERVRAKQIPVLEPDFPRGKDGGIEGRDFMVSRIDYHPNRRYNELLSAQLLQFLRANQLVRE